MYRVRLDAFEGPMDLLLYLIRKHEVDLHDIPIAPITEQYLGFLGEIESIDIDLAGEFLVMAATLMELKSRILARETERRDDEDRDDPRDEDGEDPRAELVRALLEYKKYRDAADALDARRESWSKRAPVRIGGVDSDALGEAMDELGEMEIEDLDLTDLVEAFRLIVESVNFDRLGEHEVLSDDTPIEVHARGIMETLNARGADAPPTTLRALVSGKTRVQMIGVFLALLVLVRDQRVRFEITDGEVELGLGEAADESLSDGEAIADFV